MSDDKIQVEVTGNTSGLNSSMDAAAGKVRGAMDQIKGAFSSVGLAGQNASSIIGGFAGGVLGGILVTAANSAVNAIKNIGEAFVDTIRHAQEFGMANQKAAAILGTTYKEAAALKMSLDQAGKSIEDYSAMTMRMTQRLKTGEDAWKSFGMKTRDANGELLQGRQLMASAIATMQTYKSGADQNSFALEVFGRSAAQVYDYMRLTDEEIANSAQLLADFGIRMTGAAEQSQALLNAENELGDITETFAVMIGERLMPMITQWMEAMAGPLKEGLIIVGNGLLALITIIEAVAGAFYQLAQVAIASVTAIANSLNAVASLGTAAAQAVTGDFSAAGATISTSFGKIGTDLKGSFDTMVTGAKDTQANLRAIWGDFSGTDQRNSGIKVPGSGGTKSFVPPPDDAKANKSEGKQADAQVDLWRKVEEEKVRMSEDTAQAKARIAKATLDNELAAGKISKAEYVSRQKEISNAEYTEQKAALERKAQLNQGDVVAHARTLNEIKLLELKHQGDIIAIEKDGIEKSKAVGAKKVADVKSAEAEKVKAVKAANDAIEKDEKKTAQDSASAWKSFASSITSSFGNAIKGMIHGTMTWKEALGSILDAVVDSFIDMGIQMLQNWITTMIEKQFITQATETATATTTIAGSAAQAGAGAYAATAAIPITGPAMAPAAGAAAYAGALSYEGLAFAEKGMVVDKDRLVFAHKDEQILPANIAKGMTNIINDQSNKGNKGGDTSLVYSPTVTNNNAKSLEAQLKDESRAMLGWLMQQKRNGTLKFA